MSSPTRLLVDLCRANMCLVLKRVIEQAKESGSIAGFPVIDFVK